MKCRIIVERIEVDEARLAECDRDICPFEAIVFDSERVLVDPNHCKVCLACIALCGPNTIRIYSSWTCES